MRAITLRVVFDSSSQNFVNSVRSSVLPWRGSREVEFLCDGQRRRIIYFRVDVYSPEGLICLSSTARPFATANS
jgi:hypothetical protein